MKYKKILITGGAGFVGSNLAVKFKKKYPRLRVVALDNFKRRGSEFNLDRLRVEGIEFVHGDIRCPEDLNTLSLGKKFLIIECSAEPSVLAGINSSPEYVINTNLVGTINCLELARKQKADFIFLSTSRVYPLEALNSLKFREEPTRFVLEKEQMIKGASEEGISEEFPLDGYRSMYGATKLCSELIFQEYVASYGIKGVINRCGIITGPWQMGKVDQGVVVLWLARHFFKKSLSYIGYGGKGKQVRDFIHIDDLFNLLDIQINNLVKFNGKVFNVGGGRRNSFSLLELTGFCQKITGKKIKIGSIRETRPNDVRIYITDSNKVRKKTGWKPRIDLEKTLENIYEWMVTNESQLKRVSS